MKKKLYYLFVFILFLSLLFPTSISHVEAAQKQESLNTSIKKIMKYSKDFNLKGIQSYTVSFGKYKSTYYMKTKNNELYNYFKKCNKKMTYKIVSKKQRKNTATIKLKIRYVDSYEFTENFYYRLFIDSISGRVDLDNMSEAQSDKYANSVVRTSAAGVAKTKYRTQTISLELIKKDKKWKIKKMTKAFDNILQANFPYSSEKIEKSFE